MARIGEKTAFVFTGGGSLGAIQIGMLRVLLDAGVKPDFVVGASVGAINASYFASLPNVQGVANLERIWTGLRRSDIFPFTLASAIGLIRNPGNLVDPSRLRRIIEMHLPILRLEETQIPLHIMATNLQGLGVRLSSGPAVEAILASTAIPGIFPPVEINGEPLLDGAVAANTPMRLAVQLGASRIIILPTGYACALKEPPKSAVGKALHAITLMIAWQLMHELERIPESIQVHLVPTLCPLAISPFDFSSSVELIERAARSSQKWIEDVASRGQRIQKNSRRIAIEILLAASACIKAFRAEAELALASQMSAFDPKRTKKWPSRHAAGKMHYPCCEESRV